MTIVISHSEVDSFFLCKQRHFYAFGDLIEGAEKQGMEPKTFSDSLYRGIVGHKGLEMVFKAIKTGSSLSDATSVGIMAIQEYAKEPEPKFEILADLATRIIPNYGEQVLPELFNKGWAVQEVEQTHRLEVPTDQGTMVYPFTPDAILQHRFMGSRVVDHKFIYNFYNASEIDIMPQIPKYIGALRALGIPIQDGLYNMLRWRKVKDLSPEANFKQTPFQPSDYRIKQAFHQQVNAMERIARLKAGTLDDWKNKVNLQRVQNSMICKSCSFKTLCAIEMNGGNGKLHRRLEFRPNSYGYTATEDE